MYKQVKSYTFSLTKKIKLISYLEKKYKLKNSPRMQNEDIATKKHDPLETRWPGETALPSSATKSNFDLATIQMPKE